MKSTGLEIFSKDENPDFYPDAESIAVAVDWWIYQIHQWCLLTHRDIDILQEHVQSFEEGLTQFLTTWEYDFIYTDYGPMEPLAAMLHDIHFPENLFPPNRKMIFKSDGSIFVSIGRGSSWEQIG